MARATEALSPLGVLARGYSLTQRVDSLAPLTSDRDVRTGELIQTTLHDGIVISEVVSSAPRVDKLQ